MGCQRHMLAVTGALVVEMTLAESAKGKALQGQNRDYGVAKHHAQRCHHDQSVTTCVELPSVSACSATGRATQCLLIGLIWSRSRYVSLLTQLADSTLRIRCARRRVSKEGHVGSDSASMQT